MGKRLTRDEILAADDLGGETLEVPEWGGEVRVAALSVAAANQLYERHAAGDGGVDFRVRLAAACLLDERGNPLFTEDDLAALAAKNVTVIDRLWRKAAEVIGWPVVKAVEEAEKNSGSGPGEGSPSA